jgi:uncharacterized repeat protein (TIGR03803 family)
MNHRLRLVAGVVVLLSFVVGHASAQTFTSLLSFTGTGGAYPGKYLGGDLTLSGTTFYGMTGSGGSSGDGNIFSIGIDGSGYQNLLSFSGTNGNNPVGSLTLSGTTLYGTTQDGGSSGLGNVFSIGTNGSDYQNLFSFNGLSNGYCPCGSLTLSGTTFYGVTPFGASSTTHGHGTIFSIGTNGSGFQNLHMFGGSDSEYPKGSLILSGTTLYGTTAYGGIGYVGGDTSGNGTVFSIGTNGSGYQNLFNFNGTNGRNPMGSLTLSGTTL